MIFIAFLFKLRCLLNFRDLNKFLGHFSVLFHSLHHPWKNPSRNSSSSYFFQKKFLCVGKLTHKKNYDGFKKCKVNPLSFILLNSHKKRKKKKKGRNVEVLKVVKTKPKIIICIFYKKLFIHANCEFAVINQKKKN